MDSGFYFAIAVIVLGLAFFFIYHRPIIDLINRIRSISKTGITTDPAQREVSHERDPRADAEALMRELDSALLREMEGIISNELQQRNLVGSEAVPVLIRYLASAKIALDFEIIYGLIWGSQLGLLNYLNTQPTGQPAEVLRPFYTLAASQYPEVYSGYSFEQWLGFLRDQVLVREDAGRLQVTIRGREFLAYLTRMGRTHNKAG